MSKSVRNGYATSARTTNTIARSRQPPLPPPMYRLVEESPHASCDEVLLDASALVDTHKVENDTDAPKLKDFMDAIVALTAVVTELDTKITTQNMDIADLKSMILEFTSKRKSPITSTPLVRKKKSALTAGTSSGKGGHRTPFQVLDDNKARSSQTNSSQAKQNSVKTPQQRISRDLREAQNEKISQLQEVLAAKDQMAIIIELLQDLKIQQTATTANVEVAEPLNEPVTNYNAFIPRNEDHLRESLAEALPKDTNKVRLSIESNGISEADYSGGAHSYTDDVQDEECGADADKENFISENVVESVRKPLVKLGAKSKKHPTSSAKNVVPKAVQLMPYFDPQPPSTYKSNLKTRRISMCFEVEMYVQGNTSRTKRFFLGTITKYSSKKIERNGEDLGDIDFSNGNDGGFYWIKFDGDKRERPVRLQKLNYVASPNKDVCAAAQWSLVFEAKKAAKKRRMKSRL